jgi:hypothetical protein
MDEDEVSWRDPATDGAGAPVLVRSASVDACIRHACFHAKAAESSLHARCLVLVPSVDEIGHDVGYCSRRGAGAPGSAFVE